MKTLKQKLISEKVFLLQWIDIVLNLSVEDLPEKKESYRQLKKQIESDWTTINNISYFSICLDFYNEEYISNVPNHPNVDTRLSYTVWCEGGEFTLEIRRDFFEADGFHYCPSSEDYLLCAIFNEETSYEHWPLDISEEFLTIVKSHLLTYPNASLPDTETDLLFDANDL